MAYFNTPYQFQPYNLTSPYIPNQQAIQPPTQAQQMVGISQSSRPVTSREEAYSTPADFSGAPMLFPDLSHRKVYWKQWNIQTGAADFIELSPAVTPDPPAPEMLFASLEDFDNLRGVVDGLKKELEKMKRAKVVKKDDE